MKIVLCLAVILLMCRICMTDNISAIRFINALSSAPIEKKYSMIDSFMNIAGSFPIVEQDSVVTFLTKQKAERVYIAGDFNSWELVQQMNLIPYTDLWYHTAIFEPDARLDYKFVIDGNTWILDPLNPNVMQGGFGYNSELRMPKYQCVPEIEYYEDILHGALIDTVIYSSYLKNQREITVYLPPAYDGSSEFPCIVFHDGTDYLNYAHANNILDYCISKGMIRPVIGVFISPLERTYEYAGDGKVNVGNFINKELFPFLKGHYSLSSSPGVHASIGASNGGNMSLWLGFYYSDIFGKIGAQSSFVEPDVQSKYKEAQKLPLSIYLDMGVYDIPRLEHLIENFILVLSNKGYDFVYREYPEGHSWGSWRTHLNDILIFFYGKNRN